MAHDPEPVTPADHARAGQHYIKSHYGPGVRTHYNLGATGDIVQLVSIDIEPDTERLYRALADARALADHDDFRAAVLNDWIDVQRDDSDTDGCHD